MSFWNLKDHARILSPTRPHLLTFPKQFHSLVIKHSNMGSHSHVSHHNNLQGKAFNRSLHFQRMSPWPSLQRLWQQAGMMLNKYMIIYNHIYLLYLICKHEAERIGRLWTYRGHSYSEHHKVLNCHPLQGKLLWLRLRDVLSLLFSPF